MNKLWATQYVENLELHFIYSGFGFRTSPASKLFWVLSHGRPLLVNVVGGLAAQRVRPEHRLHGICLAGVVEGVLGLTASHACPGPPRQPPSLALQLTPNKCQSSQDVLETHFTDSPGETSNTFYPLHIYSQSAKKPQTRKGWARLARQARPGQGRPVQGWARQGRPGLTRLLLRLTAELWPGAPQHARPGSGSSPARPP